MTESATERKPWAMLAYTVADDKGGGRNLDSAAKLELMAICDASDFSQVSVAAQVDFKKTPGVFRAALTAAPQTRELEDKEPDNHPLWRTILKHLTHSTMKVQVDKEDSNAARASVLEDFLRYGHGECPADRHVIFFYGHAHGPMGLFYDKDAGRRAPKTSLRLNHLADSLQTDKSGAALLVFRDCFMNTLESAYQFRHVAEFMIASQSLVPVSGIWPWSSMLSALMPSTSSADQGLTFAKNLGRFLDAKDNREPFHDAPMSLLDLSVAHSLAKPLKGVADALEHARKDPHHRAACAAALEAARVGYPDTHATPGDPSLLDVPTMCENLGKISMVAKEAKALGEVVTRLVRWHHTQGDRYKGTSIYYQPSSKHDQDRSCIYDEELVEEDKENYRTLSLIQATGWDRIALDPL